MNFLTQILQSLLVLSVFSFAMSQVIYNSGRKKDSGMYSRYLGGAELKKAENKRAILAERQKGKYKQIMMDAKVRSENQKVRTMQQDSMLEMIRDQRGSQLETLTNQRMLSNRDQIREQKERIENAQARYRDLMASREMMMR